ncbi:lactonase family protein [bacterium]|nr:lactonase family protein [bacterium]
MNICPRISVRSFFCNSISFIIAAGSCVSVRAVEPESPPLIAYVGTFSSPLGDVLPTQVDLPPGNGKGIHRFQVNPTNGDLTALGVFPMGNSPSCLAINAAGNRLYSANETERWNGTTEGSISSFRVSEPDGKLTILNTVPSGGAGPTYVSLHPSEKYLFVANYFGGSVAVLTIEADGTLGHPICIQEDKGKIGPTVATNSPKGSFAFSGHDRTHAHMIQSDPSGNHVLHIDLALDKIYLWKFDQLNGQLTPGDQESVSLPPGDGPRHFHFHPNGQWFYSVQEEGSTVALFNYDSDKGTLDFQKSWSTLPPDFAGSNFCSEILVSGDGKYVYAGNRLYDTIAIFSVGDRGHLKYQGEVWTRGNYPRSFHFDPSEDFLYCCNQRADNVTVFRVDHQTGELAFTGHYQPVGNPSHIVFRETNRQ